MSGKQKPPHCRAIPRLRIYDNSTRFVTCCCDQSKALCHPDRLGPLNTENPDIPTTVKAQLRQHRPAPTATSEQAAETIARHQAEMASPLTLNPLRARLAQRIAAAANDHRHNTERTNDGPSN